ncbi:MAG: DUF6493 family protein [Propionibacteriaceae bacterium]|nr:DUF6493 family protein [Propionibacteriaceae bacterium]
MNKGLAAAVAIFEELGWGEAAPADTPSLPLGTPEQQKVAKAGLLKGEWFEWVDGKVTMLVDADRGMLGAFALRLGVPARRAAQVFPSEYLDKRWTAHARAQLIASRGPKFVTDYISNTWGNAGALIEAIALTDAEVPPHDTYLTSWQSEVVNSLSDESWDEKNKVSPELLGASYAKHVQAILDGGLAAPHNPEVIIGEGLRRGWLDAEGLREPVAAAMDQAQRPIDRVTWARILTGQLAVEPAWLLERSSMLLATMSFGDDPIITLFTPVLLGSGDDDLILNTLLIGLNAKSAKARAAVLTAAAAVPAPSAEVAQVVAETAAPLLTHKNRALVKAAKALLDAWQVTAEPLPEEEPAEARGLWQPTPPLAEAPRFDAGPVTPEHLTALAAELVMVQSDEVALNGERFLATANALAREDVAATRTALRGVRNSWTAGLSAVEEWVKEDDQWWTLDRGGALKAPVIARDAAVFQRLGSVPVLLSTPSWDDFRIAPAELASRLDAYAEASAAASEADFQMALGRLDLSLLDEATTARLSASQVPIVLQNGREAAVVGSVLSLWIKDPMVHPGYDDEHRTLAAKLTPVAATIDLPQRFTESYSFYATKTLFPNWVDAPLGGGRFVPGTFSLEPLGPVPAAQLLNTVGPDATPLDDAIAAWQGGMLVPGVADARRLVVQGVIGSLAARAEGWAELAEAGLLSVLWPLVDDVIAFSSSGARVAPGVAELVEWQAKYLPEARAAVENGVAGPEVFALQGVRALAARGGSSRAVTVARALVAQLPAVEVAPEAAPQVMTDEEFEAAWKVVPDPAVVPDDATVRFVVEKDAVVSTYLTTSDGAEWRSGGRDYPLVHYHQADVVGANRKHLHAGYDAASGTVKLKGGTYRRHAVLSHSMVLMLFGSLLHGGTYLIEVDSLFTGEAQGGDAVGPTRVAAAVEEVLAQGMDPYLLVRQLVKTPRGLPALYPVLTRAIRHAATLEGKPPAWLVRIIDVATAFAPVLKEAAARGLLLPEDAAWPGLAEVAASSKSPAAKRKAKLLLEMTR